MAPLFKNWVGGSTAGKYSYTPDFPSNRGGTFGKLSNKAKLRPDDDSIMFVTQVTAIDAKDRETPVTSYEMDQMGHFAGDSGSERRIITPPLEVLGNKRANKEGKKSGGKSGVRVNTEYRVDRSDK